MSRPVAVACTLFLVVGTFAGRLAAEAWLLPPIWRIEPDPLGLLVWALVWALTLALPLLLIYAVVAPVRSRPASFQIGPEPASFSATGSLHQAGMTAVGLWILADVIEFDPRPGGTPWRLDTSTYAVVWDFLAMGAATVVLVVFFLRIRRRIVVLDRDGLTIRSWRHNVVIRWDQLLPGGPPPPRSALTEKVELYLNQLLPTGRYRWESLPVGWVDVDPSFLTAVVRHYVEHPEHRPAIGTVAELARLRATVAY